MAKMQAKNLKVSADKAHFCLSQVKLLGKIVTSSGVVPDPDMIKDMQNFPPPKNGKQVLSFLGLCGVYMNHIPDYMKLAEPLYKLAHKDAAWVWGVLLLILKQLCS